MNESELEIMCIHTKTELLPHQALAVDKLRHLKVGALYMEMGTGKTRTALELFSKRLSAGKVRWCLWMCPCAVKASLRNELEKHSDDVMKYVKIFGIDSLSNSSRTMNTLMNLVMARPAFLVVDESSMVKNHTAIRSQRIEKIASYCQYRLILNGTPVSKNEADLFEQWKILDWRILGYKSYYSFSANHLEYDSVYKKNVRRVLNVDYLTDKIAPYSFQVLKSECTGLSIPQKEYSEVGFYLTDEQTDHYHNELEDFLCLSARYEQDNIPEAVIYRTFNALQQVTSGRRITTPASERIQHEPFFKAVSDNPRIAALKKVIECLGNEKAIIWCKFMHEICAVQELLSCLGLSFAMFIGKLPQKKRQASIEMFEKGTQFLIANKSCAGYGLNLQFCHNAIYYDNDWDWATRVQSEDRIHRIGQTETVHIWDICANAAIDGRIISCLMRKEKMSDAFKKHIGEKNLAAWLCCRGMEELHDKDRTKQHSKE